jgi:glutamate/tyrosine decarboxylase-like PLP-dependent enzyme
VQKAADLFGLGTAAIRWIGTDSAQRIDVGALTSQIVADKTQGDLPFLLVGSAGTVSTGAVDPLPELARIAKQQDLWFHVDGAYGAPAVCSGLAPQDLEGLRLADSLAIDAHKWLYVPLEAGCALVRDRAALRETFAYHPSYYHYADVGEETVHFLEYGPQNSRSFRALKVWFALRQAGRANYAAAIGRNIELSREMFACVEAAPELEAVTQNLSVATFRFVPADLDAKAEGAGAYLDELNTALLDRIQKGERIFLSNAVVDGRFLLRACITNFRTAEEDVRAVPEIVTRIGRELDAELRPKGLGAGG